MQTLSGKVVVFVAAYRRKGWQFVRSHYRSTPALLERVLKRDGLAFRNVRAAKVR